MFCVQRVKKWTMEELLFKNPPMILASVGGQFRRAGLTKLVPLRRVDCGGWRTADDIAAQTGVHSLRLVEMIMVGVQAFWPCLQLSGEDEDEVEGAHNEEAPFFPSVHVRVKVGEWLESWGLSKQVLYMVSVKVKHLRALEGLRAGAWQQEGFITASKNWRLLYKSPLPKRSGDLQWRIIHGVTDTWHILTRHKKLAAPFVELRNL